MTKFLNKPDFVNKEISNVVLENVTTVELANITPHKGKFLYNEDTLSPVVGNGNTFSTFNITNNLGKIKTKVGNVETYSNATINEDTFTFEAGDNILFETNGKNIKFIATGNGSPNYSNIIGDGINKNYEITHNLNSLNLITSLWENKTSGNLIYTDTNYINSNIILLKFFEPPTTNSIRVVISERKGNPNGGNGTKGDKGDIGPQGVQGATGSQGVQGQSGNVITNGNQYETVRFSSDNTLSNSNILLNYDSNITVNVSSSSNVLVLKNNSNVILNVNKDGIIKSPYYANTSMLSGPLVYVKTNGDFEKSNVDINLLYNSTIDKKMEVVITSQQLIMSATTPIVLLTNLPNEYTWIKSVMAIMYSGTTMIPYVWNIISGIGYFNRLRLWDVPQSLKEANNRTVSFSHAERLENNIVKCYPDNGVSNNLIFHTDMSSPLEPYGGNGNLKLIIDYSIYKI